MNDYPGQLRYNQWLQQQCCCSDYNYLRLQNEMQCTRDRINELQIQQLQCDRNALIMQQINFSLPMRSPLYYNQDVVCGGYGNRQLYPPVEKTFVVEYEIWYKISELPEPEYSPEHCIELRTPYEVIYLEVKRDKKEKLYIYGVGWIY